MASGSITNFHFLTDKNSNYHLELEGRECSAPVASRRVSSACKPKTQTIQRALRVPSLHRNQGYPKVELLLAPSWDSVTIQSSLIVSSKPVRDPALKKLNSIPEDDTQTVLWPSHTHSYTHTCTLKKTHVMTAKCVHALE